MNSPPNRPRSLKLLRLDIDTALKSVFLLGKMPPKQECIVIQVN
jgi:hypothetical protein